MNYLPPTVPPMLDKFYSKFDFLFSQSSQTANFRWYGTGLLLEIKRKNIQSISQHILLSNYQSMHHFIHDAPWNHNELNRKRIEMLQNTRPTKSCDNGYVILDDTGNPKSGDATFGTRRQWIGSLGKVDCGQVVVTIHYADLKKDWPIDHRPYLPQKWVEAENSRLDKQVYVFKSKLQLGLELIDDLPKAGIQFSHLLMDGWYGNSPDFIKSVEDKEHLYITALYANRRVFFRLPGEPARNEHYMRDVVTALASDAFSAIQYTKANGELCTVYVAEIRLKIKNLTGKRRVLIVKPTPEEKDMELIDVLMTNDMVSDAPFLLRSWSFRDKIDKFYQRAKDELGFDQYQVRDETSISRHWYMVFLMYSFLIFHRQCGSFKKWCRHFRATFGQLLDTIRTKLMLHFQLWCKQNPDPWNSFLQNEKGIPSSVITDSML